MLTNEDLRLMLEFVKEDNWLAESDVDSVELVAVDTLDGNDVAEIIDELLALRSIRDAGDEEVEKLRHTIADLGPSLAGEADRLRDIAISRGQELREAREELERLKEEMETSVSEAEERANERGRQIATLTAERDEAWKEIERLNQVVQELKGNFGEMEVGA